MENRNRKNKTRKKAVLKPPKKKASPQLSRDEMRNIKKKKVSKRRKLKKHFLSFLLAVVVLCVGTVLVFSVFFKINTVSVTGDKVYSEKTVIEKSGIETVLWDERCTTVSAHTALNYTNTRGKKRKETVDAVAAVMILEDYLRFRKNMK